MVEQTDFQKAVELINASKKVLVTCHTRPDGDACGSVRAIELSLKSMGKEVTPIFLSPVAGWYLFMFDEAPVILGNDITEEQMHAGHFDECDLVIICDTNSYVQLPRFDEWLKKMDKPVIVIDHHVTGDGLGTVELIDKTAAATGEIVFDLHKHAGWDITDRIAEMLFISISTDTGWFKFPNTVSRIYRIAADLIDAGANPNEIFRMLYQSYTPERMKLMVRMLDSMELHFDNRLATQFVMRKDFDETGSTGRDTENMIDECQKIASVEVAALFVELADGGFRCSLRSKLDVDVRKIAQLYGGGGHTKASGVNLPGPMDKAKQIVLDAVSQQLK